MGPPGDLGDWHVLPAGDSEQCRICAVVEVDGQPGNLGASPGSRHRICLMQQKTAVKESLDRLPLGLRSVWGGQPTSWPAENLYGRDPEKCRTESGTDRVNGSYR